MPRSPSCCPESRRSVPEGRNATQLGRGYSGPWSRSSIRRLLFAFHSPQTAARPPVQVLRGPFPAEPRRGRVRHPTRNWNLRPLSFCFLESEVSVPPDDRGIFFFFLSRWKPTGASPGSRGPGVQKSLGPLSPLASGTRWLLSSGQRTPSVLGKILESLRGRVPSASPASLWETPPGCFGIGPPGSSSPFVFNRLSLCPFALVSTLFSISFIFRPLYAIRHLCARDFNPQGLVLLSPSRILLLLFF